MQAVNHFSEILFPEYVSFHFKKVDDGQTIKLTFYSHIKMKEFIQDVIEKSYMGFNIPNTKTIQVIDANNGENGMVLDSEDETLISVKYAHNYKYKAFYILVN